LYCSVDPALYYPQSEPEQWDIAYLGTYAADRQAALENVLFNTARRHPHRSFVVAGPQYPHSVIWPPNVERIEHLPASEHRHFYNSQKFTLNLTRRDMIRSGYSPSVRLFEAGACGIPILTDDWPGLQTFYEPYSEILPIRTDTDLEFYLHIPEEQRLEVAQRARERTLRFHTAAVRAREFEAHVNASVERISSSKKRGRAALEKSSTAALL
jgi:spore maturation protein CgeB